MIRKLIIVIFTLGTVGTGVLWGITYIRPFGHSWHYLDGHLEGANETPEERVFVVHLQSGFIEVYDAAEAGPVIWDYPIRSQ